MSVDHVKTAINAAINAADGPLADNENQAEMQRERLKTCVQFPLNDTGNGHRLLTHFGDYLLWVREVGPHFWNGRHWDPEGGAECVIRFAQRTAELISHEADYIEYQPYEKSILDAAKQVSGDDDLDDKSKQILLDAAVIKKQRADKRAARRKFAISSGNTNKISGMKVQAEAHATYSPSVMDSDPFTLNCENVTLEFRRAPDEPRVLEVIDKPHDRDDKLTKCTAVKYDKLAKCPNWEKFLEQMMPEEETRDFLQVYMGYSLTGKMSEQKILYMYGKGGNGKSLFIDTICKILGGYSSTLNPESVSGKGQRKGGDATPDLMLLVGTRLCRISELPKAEPLKEELVKAMSGGEPMLVRDQYKGFILFYPCFKAVFSANDYPWITSTDDGIWRRLLIVHWKVKVTAEQWRPMEEIMGEFMQESSGILNWLIEGLRRYFEEGLVIPDSVRHETDRYRGEMDIVQMFVDACLIKTDPDDPNSEKNVVQASKMYRRFCEWCEASGEVPFKQKTFGRDLTIRKGFEKKKSRVVYYQNVKLREIHELDHIERRDLP